jgi:CrcB protein
MMGGGLGAVGRYAISGVAQRFLSQNLTLLGIFPWGTLVVNSLGSLAIGISWAIFDRFIVSSHFKSFFVIGFVGAFTTFSTYSLETIQLLRQGEMRIALLNILFNNFICLFLVLLGFFLVSIFIKN